MTGVEIAAVVEGGLQLITKIAELIQAANKGDVQAAEVLKNLTERPEHMKAIGERVHKYIDEKFDK